MAAPHLEALNLSTGETINFSSREDDHAILIYKLEPTTGMLRTRAYIGQHMPPLTRNTITGYRRCTTSWIYLARVGKKPDVVRQMTDLATIPAGIKAKAAHFLAL
ncbi:YiaKLMNOPQRS operon repressor [Raoultella terrigena]|uniref:YiaKLMNOPQRS operon repressor n=1 Tax=Raoultella terrigena TaxID=577 RepID=A0A4U9D9E0_RAOTE|nr:YiaKLMNOPQRS operon repressor [Raoultella terrigena]